MTLSPPRASAAGDVVDLDERALLLRWPDGTERASWAPALVREHLLAGAAYPVPELVDRVATALMRGSAAVQRRYGFPCPHSAAALAALTRVAAPYGEDDVVLVLRLP